jgi:hypothetical protein
MRFSKFQISKNSISIKKYEVEKMQCTPPLCILVGIQLQNWAKIDSHSFVKVMKIKTGLDQNVGFVFLTKTGVRRVVIEWKRRDRGFLTVYFLFRSLWN